MSRVRAFFVAEAEECLDVARSAATEPTDLETLYRAVRRLRGSAQVARFGALAEAAAALEERLKVAAGPDGPWTPEAGRRVRTELESLADGVAAVRDGRMEQDEREPTMDEQTGNEPTGAEEVVPMESLEYQGDAALERAQELREPLEDAIVAGDPPGAIIDELFDLIRLGAK